MEEPQVVRALAALAQAMRLRIFRQLVVAGPAGLTPGVLTAALDVSATALSFHLRGLTQSGLVSQERQGRNLVYRAEFGQMDALLRYLTDNCCAGEPCLPSSDATAAACRPTRR